MVLTRSLDHIKENLPKKGVFATLFDALARSLILCIAAIINVIAFRHIDCGILICSTYTSMAGFHTEFKVDAISGGGGGGECP